MREHFYLTYAPDTDITFVMKDVEDTNGVLKSTEVVGWYYGEPEDEAPAVAFNAKLKAEY